MSYARITVAAMGLLALTACGSATAENDNESTEPADLKGHTYTIENLDGKAFHEKLMKDSKLTIKFTDQGQINLGTDCNMQSGSVKTDDGVIKADKLIGTEKACEGSAMEQERWAVEFIKDDPKWELVKDKLTISSGSSTLTLTQTGQK